MDMPRKRLILGSGSPRRRELLASAGYEFEVVVPDDVETGVCSSAGPIELVRELALRKAINVSSKLSKRDDAYGAILVTADTVAECDGQIVGKPHDESHAEQMLRKLSGKHHRVLTGLCVWPIAENEAPQLFHVRVDTTTLRMDKLSESQLVAYLDSGLWEGKAGSFGYQDGLDWVHVEQGSETNVVGLPMELLAEMIQRVAS